jgi:hypothetical protein
MVRPLSFSSTLFALLALLALLVVLCPERTHAENGMSQITVNIDGKGVPIDIYRDYDAEYMVHPNSSYARHCVFTTARGDSYDFRSFGGSFYGKAYLPTGKSMFRFR